MAKAGAIHVRTMNLLAGKIRAGVTTGRARRGRREVHPLAGRDAGVQGLPRLPRLDLRVAEPHGRARDPGQVQAAQGRHPVGRHRRGEGRLGRRRRADVPGRRGLARSARSCSRSPRGRCSAPSSSAGSGNRLGDVSNAVQTHVEGDGLSSCARSSATASAARCTRSRRSPTTARPARASCSRRAWCSRSSRWSPPGRHMVRMGDDGWAIYSQDGSLAAHFEFTVAVTAAGPRILTPWHLSGHAPRRSASRRLRAAGRAARREPAPAVEERERAPRARPRRRDRRLAAVALAPGRSQRVHGAPRRPSRPGRSSGPGAGTPGRAASPSRPGPSPRAAPQRPG